MQPIQLPLSTAQGFASPTRLRKRGPAPTNPSILFARDSFGETNCAYLNGDPQLPLNCASSYDCTHDGAASVSGCCAIATNPPNAPCNLPTTCIDYTSPLPPPPPRALTCNEDKPFCTTGIFIDGYAMFTCGSGDTGTQVSALYHSTGASDSSSTGGFNAASSPSSVSSLMTSVEPQSNAHSNGDSHEDSSSSAATVIGAVIGGIAIALIAFFLAWFVLRTKRKDQSSRRIPSPPASVIEMVKPASASNQLGELHVDEKKSPMYSEIEAPRQRYTELHAWQKSRPELAGTELHHAYEMHAAANRDSTFGRSELA